MRLKLLKFSSTTCMPCKMLSDVLMSVNPLYDIQITSLDIVEDADQASLYNVRSVPALVLIDEDVPGVPVAVSVGAKPKTELMRWLEANKVEKNI